MAANLQQQMAAGQMMGQQRPPQQRFPPTQINQQQLSQIVVQNLMANPNHPPGWQASVGIPERMGKAINLISNAILATPGQDWQRAAHFGLDFERKMFNEMPDKATWEKQLNAKTHEMFTKRQSNEAGIAQNLQNNLQAQAAAQAQAQAQAVQQQQQQLFLNQNAALQGQMGGPMGQPIQRGLQHLQQPMQASPIPQQPQLMGMNMANPGMRVMPGQNNMQMPQNQMRPNNGGGTVDMANLSAADRQKVEEFAMRLYTGADDTQKSQLMMSLTNKLTPQQMANIRSSGKDPLMWYFCQQAYSQLKSQAQNLRRQQGLNPQQQAMQLQQQQQQQQQQLQRAMNPQMMNAVAQQNGGQVNQFSGFESIMNEQKQGIMAEQAGQVVVPANQAQPGRNATPQPMHNMNNQQTPNQPQRTQQMQQAFNVQNQNAQMRAQAAAKQLQGQPGGLGGPMPASQSPAMNTLNAPVRRPPVPMGQADGPQQVPVNPQFNQTLDPRFGQLNQRPISMTGNINANNPGINTLMANMSNEERQKFAGMPPEKLNELMAKWQQRQQQAVNKNQPMQGRPDQPQPGQFNQMNGVNPANMMNLGQQPNIAAAQNTQQNMVQAQLQRARMSNVANVSNQQQMVMDTMDIPPQILTQFPGNLPPEVKKWKDLKAWIQQNPVPDQIRDQLVGLQMMQFKQILDKRNQQRIAQGAGAQPTPGPAPNRPQNMPGGIPRGLPPNLMQVSQQEIANARANNQQVFGNMSDEAIRRQIIKWRSDQFMKTLQANGAGQMPGGQMQQPLPQQLQQQQMPQQNQAPVQAMPVQGDAAAAAQSAAPVAPPKQAPVAPSSTGADAGKSGAGQQNRPATANSTATPATNNRKRAAATEEASQAQNQPAPPAQKATLQQPAAKPQQKTALTKEQIAALNPDQRARYEAMIRNRQNAAAQAPPELMNKLKVMGGEENKAFAQDHHPDIAMTPQEKVEVGQKIKQLVETVVKVGRTLGRWYTLIRDDNRARMFFRTRFRLVRQFQDADKMQMLKDTFSISAAELDQAKIVLDGMLKEVEHHVLNQQQAAQPGAGQQPAATQAQAAAVQPAASKDGSADDNAKATKAHNRSNSKSGPPAAPTSSAPPFPLHAASPHGQPAYIGKPAVTQETLVLPPGKRRKTSAATTAQSNTASPQAKPPSPENKRQPAAETRAPQKPTLPCPDPSCDNTSGFTSEDARQKHVQEEHIKPYEDPAQFLMDSLAVTLGVDSQGRALVNTTQQVPLMEQGQSSQGQTIPLKQEAATPMARAASMNQQGNTAGSKGPEAMKNIPMSNMAPIPGGPLNMSDATTVPQSDEQAASLAWQQSMALVNPSDLLLTFGASEPAAGGAVTDLRLFRSWTPNDTPESSKDSGASEPNSDISEGTAVDIDISWHPMDADLLLNMDAFNMDGGDGLDMMGSAEMEPLPHFNIDWDKMKQNFDEPITLDMSLYSLDGS